MSFRNCVMSLTIVCGILAGGEASAIPPASLCDADSDCGAGAYCDRYWNECMELGTDCETAEDCDGVESTSDYHCDHGWCSFNPASCQTDDECPEGTLCVRGTGECLETNPYCETDDDCPEGLICYGEWQECVEPGDECTTDADCLSWQVCSPGDGDSWCKSIGCATDEDCRVPTICSDDGECAARPRPTCELDEDCPEGMRCSALNGTCVAVAPKCESDEDCPAGKYCARGEGECRFYEANNEQQTATAAEEGDSADSVRPNRDENATDAGWQDRAMGREDSEAIQSSREGGQPVQETADGEITGGCSASPFGGPGSSPAAVLVIGLLALGIVRVRGRALAG